MSTALAQQQGQTDQAEQVQESFPGFEKGNGYTQFDNAILNRIISQISNAAELKIVMYIYRHTEGYHQTEVAISIQEFITGRLRRNGEPLDDGTGLCERSVKSAIQRAITHGYIERRQVGNTVYFKLRMAAEEEQSKSTTDQPPAIHSDTRPTSQDQTSDQTTATSQTNGVQNLHLPADTKRVQNLHPKGGKTCTPSDKTCTPSVQNLHPQAPVNQPQERPQTQPKEKRKTNYSKDREKEKGVSLSPSSNSSLGERQKAGRVQRSGDVTTNPQLGESPANAIRANQQPTLEERQKLQERLTALRLERERREAAELERVKVYA